MNNKYNKYNEYNIAWDYPFKSQTQRLIMIGIVCSGDPAADGIKIINDKWLVDFCCCSSSEFITAMNFLVEQGFVVKRNFGLQSGQASNGYTISVPASLRR